MEGLLAMLLSDRMGVSLDGNGNGNGGGAARPEAEALREQIRQGLSTSRQPGTEPAIAPAAPALGTAGTGQAQPDRITAPLNPAQQPKKR
jgi:hypothetical protein